MDTGTEESGEECSTLLSRAEKRDLYLLWTKLSSHLCSLRIPVPNISTTLGHSVPQSMGRGFQEEIGLLRSEQMASNSPDQIRLCAALLRGESGEVSEQLGKILREDIRGLISLCSAARIRLFDFRIADHFPEELREDLPPSLARGGDALRSYPELYEVQIDSVFSALHDFYEEHDPIDRKIEIVMPSLSTPEDVDLFIARVSTAAESFGLERGRHYTIGVMAETTGFCKNVSGIASKVDTVSIGSNDLTSGVLNIGRGDTIARKDFLDNHGFDPFVSPDPQVFGKVIPDLIKAAKESNPCVHLCLCGDHGGNPDLIAKLTKLGVHEFSVAPSHYNTHILPLLVLYGIYENRTTSPSSKISMAPR